jgi:5'-3' exonuclease
MGIQDINKFLKDEGVGCFGTGLVVDHLAGYRVAIDAANWVCVTAPGCYRDAARVLVDPVDETFDRLLILRTMLNRMICFQIFWMKSGVTPVWVWEGGCPPEKDETRADRKKIYQDKYDKMVALREELRKVDPLFRTYQKLEELKKLMCDCERITREESEYLRSMVEGFGFPSIEAPKDVEADPICAALVIEGLAVGVWTTDTDHYAYGTALMLTGHGIRTPDDKETLDYTLPAIIKHHLEITQEQLRELCIISKCDYNKRMPGYGCKKGYKLLIAHDWTIEGIAAKTKLDTSPLKAARCRELLTIPASGYSHGELRVNKELFLERVRPLAEQYQIAAHFEKLVQAVKNLPEPRETTLTK